MHLKDKINIIEFCEDPQLLNMKLLSTQAVLLKIAYAIPLTRAEKNLFKDMTDGEEPPRGKVQFNEIVLLLGRGSGKSVISAAAASYEGTCTDWNQFLRKNKNGRPVELAWIFVVATREKQAVDIGRNMIFAMIEASPVLSQMIVTDYDEVMKKSFPRTSSQAMVLTTGAAIIALPCSAKVGRGYPTAGFILDEFAWYTKESRQEATDRGIYDSLLPRTLQFRGHSKVFLISSPGEKEGLAWERWVKRRKTPDLYFCAKISTRKMRPDYSTNDIENLIARSPMGAERELGAEFLSTKQPLISREAVERCVREEEPNLSLPYNPKFTYEMAFDAAFGDNDRFAISVGHVESEPSGLFRPVIDLVEFLSSQGEADFVEVCADRVAQIYKQYDLLQVYCDQYQAEPFAQILDKKMVNTEISRWVTGTHRLKYGRLKNFMRRKLLSLPNNQELVEEIAGLELKFLPNIGQYTVTHKPGGHDDGADTVAEVVYRLTEDLMTESGIVTSSGENVKV